MNSFKDNIKNTSNDDSDSSYHSDQFAFSGINVAYYCEYIIPRADASYIFTTINLQMKLKMS